MFDPKSRYANLPTYSVSDSRGRMVQVVPAAPPPEQELAGLHVRKDGQRLDLLAGRYLDDPCAFWRICELASVMVPDALNLAAEIPIPKRTR
jgi:hypothetical protein